MFLLLALLFIVVPLAELYVIVQVGQAIGVWNTIGLLLLFSLVGAWLAKHEGLVVYQRVQQRLARGEVPGREMLDGFLVLTGGLLLLVPGFITDMVGVVLLFPPTRAVARAYLRRRFSVQVLGGPPARPPTGGARPGDDDVIDL
jgi:UPF0716 protein FxsA